MRCTACGAEVPPGMLFCGNCATPVGSACPGCGFLNPRGHRFCGQCGASLAALARSEWRDKAKLELDSAAERRQVTVMFCDLSGSTALSERLDPEELREVILAYRQVCGDAVARFHGQVARYLGDGIMVHFGYPRASDADATNAIRASLEIVSQVSQLGERLRAKVKQDLTVHIGIHTGVVVAGDLVGGGTTETRAVVGETPNIAARLEALAEPGTVVISRATWVLTQHQFECVSLGPVRLKGIARSMELFQVVGERAHHGWLDAIPGRDLSPLMDRHDEVNELAARWRKVVSGAGQGALVVAEPGVGKSRLVQAFEHGVQERHALLVCQCASHSTNSALLPLVEVIGRQALIGRGDSGIERLQKLEQFVDVSGLGRAESVPLLAALMSIPYGPDHDLPDLSPKRQREKTIELLIEWLVGLSRDQPLVLIVEDVHWADASTLEILGLMLDQLARRKILLLMTARPEFVAPWAPRSHYASIKLAPLAHADALNLARSVSGDRPLPEDVLNALVARTDGIPLFVEELTKMVLESAVVRERDGRYELAGPLEALEIPSTLRGSLTARLDRLEETKVVAQLAATIGREFSYALLHAVAPLDDKQLQASLKRLVEAELLYQRGLPPRSIYVFKHTLIQEAAYRSLLRATRFKYHERIADVLSSEFPEIAENQPELLAHHQEMAGRCLESVRLLRQAAKRASDRSANVEAIAHLRKALKQLEGLAESPERRHEEVRARVALGAALIATKGYAAEEVEQTYARARVLCREIGDTPQLLSVLRGVQSFYQVHGPVELARETSEQILAHAERSGDPAVLVQAHRRLGWSLFCLGRMREGRGHLDHALALYDRAQSRSHIDVFDSDPGVIGLVNSAWLEWFVGFPGRARERSRRSIELARELSHPLSLAYALCMSAAVEQGCGATEAVRELAHQTDVLAAENGFSYWAAWAAVLEGWAIARQGNPRDGALRISDGIARYRATGAELFRPYSLSLLADVHLGAANVPQGLACVEEGLRDGATRNVHFVDAELHRLRGELLAAAGDRVAARAALSEALRISEAQDATMIQLRAALALSRLGHVQEDRRAAQTHVAGILARMSPDLDLPEAKEAREMLSGVDTA